MTSFIARRLLWFIPMLVATSLLCFVVIQLPPGDAVTAYVAQAASMGETVSAEQVEELRRRFGLDQPLVVQYLRWIGGVLRGDFGISFEHRAPVAEVLGPRVGMTALVAFASLLAMWAIALPLGIIAAVRRNSPIDYAATFVSFVGLATPSFILALVLMYVSAIWFGASVGGLFSPEFINAPWSVDRVLDLLSKLWIPVVVIGLGGMAALTRIMRANLIDELQKPYVETARAKGLSETRAILKYPVRMAISPFVSTIAWVMPSVISGELIVATVLNLPTAGPLLLQALRTQDVYLAGAVFLAICVMVLVATLLSDILLGLLDPRIRMT